MTAPVETIDFDQVYADICARLEADKERRLVRPLIRIWDGDWNLRGTVTSEISASFQWLNNETGIGTIELPLDNYIARWMADFRKRNTARNINITVDKDGARWDGLLDELLVIKDDTGKRYIRAVFKHSYEHLKHILAWSNPFVGAPVLN